MCTGQVQAGLSPVTFTVNGFGGVPHLLRGEAEAQIIQVPAWSSGGLQVVAQAGCQPAAAKRAADVDIPARLKPERAQATDRHVRANCHL